MTLHQPDGDGSTISWRTTVLGRVYLDFADRASLSTEWAWIGGRVLLTNALLAVVLSANISGSAWLSAVLIVGFIHAYTAVSAVLLLRRKIVAAFAIGTAGDVLGMMGTWLALVMGDAALLQWDETHLMLFPLLITLPYRYGIYVGTGIAAVLMGWYAFSGLTLVEAGAAAEELPTRFLFLITTLALATTFRYFLDQKAKTLVRETEVLRRLNEAKTSFVGMVSHELRTPLTAILVFITGIARNREQNLTEGQIDRLKKVEQNSMHLSMLIDDLVDVSKMERGELDYADVEFDLLQLIQESVDTTAYLARKHRQSVEISGPRGVAVTGDKNRYRQVLNNLLSNAFKYSVGGTSVSVSATVTREGLEVRVRNSGGGLRDEDKTQMFELFHRVDNEATRAANGTGIGLHITRVIVERHGGTIRVDSDHDATTLIFTIPGDRVSGADQLRDAA